MVKPGSTASACRAPTEAQIQNTILDGLRALGYTVLSTSEHRRAIACPHCHGLFTPSGGRGVDKSIPDLLVGDEQGGVWIGLEVKSASGRLRPGQAELATKGLIRVVRSLEEALDAVSAINEKGTGK